MNKQIVAFLFLTNLCLASTVNGQWQILRENTTTTRILYCIQDDEIKSSNKYIFPEYWKEDTVVRRGYKIKFDKAKNETSILKKGDYYYKIELKKPISFHLDSTIIYARAYLDNMKGFKLCFHSNLNGRWFQIKFNADFTKYQVPFYYRLSQDGMMPVYTNSEKNKEDTLKSVPIDAIFIVPEMLSSELKPILTFAEFKIFNAKIDTTKYHHPFFQTLTADGDFDLPANSFSKIPSLNSNLLSFSWHISLQEGEGQIIMKREKGIDPNEALYKLFDRMFFLYPFYDEKGLKKEYFIDKTKILYQNDSLSLQEKISKTQLLIDELHDPHFKFYEKSKGSNPNTTSNNVNKKTNKGFPILPGILGNSVYVCAVLDSSFYALGVTPGLKIIKLNNRPVFSVIDSIEKMGIKLSSLQQSKYLFNYAFNSDAKGKITLCNSVGTGMLELPIQKTSHIRIPDSFSPVHAQFKEIEPGIGYFRLNRFLLGDYIRFINHYKTLKKCSSLIIDIRNNPGGHTIEVLRIISTLIKHSYIFAQEEINFRGGIQTETHIVSPNRYFDLSHLHIVLLINEETICAGEELAYFLQHYRLATIIGNSKTPGHIAHTQDLIIPEYDIRMRFNMLTKRYTCDYQILEEKGVMPDISVSLLLPDDLYPYQDKILKTAIHYLSAYN
jgi:C-terminal processing protease CtpA/Prc